MEVLVDDGVNLPKRLTGRKGWGICSTHFRPYLPTKRALEKLEISRAESESFGNAYMRVMSQENGLEYTSPVHRALADAIIENVSAYRFYFWLV